MEINGLQMWVARLDRRLYAVLVGVAIGGIGGLIGLLIAAFEPLIAAGVILGALAALYILTDVSAALYALIAVMALIPFGTFPVKIGFTPTLLDGAFGAFLLVYLFQWMTGRRQFFRLTPVHAPLLLYLGWLILSFVLGLRHAAPTATIARQFAETLLSIGMVFVLVDLLRDPTSLRRLVLVIMVAAGTQALAALVLYVMPDAAAERTLIRLARIGYPNGGVIRYIEDNPEMAERAIGTWVDPNAFGGFLAVTTAMIAPQVFARKPVLRWRLLAWVVLGIVGAALLLTYSRASLLAVALSIVFIGMFRGYRKFLALAAAGFVAMLLIPQTQAYLFRFVEAFTASDLSTQMRIGEYGDAFRLIQRYPITGVGFTGTPEIDIYTNAASMYLIMANEIGLVGVAIFASVMIGIFSYGLKAWRRVQDNVQLRSILLGFHAALLAALLNATADLYFFR
ncbi:MAG: O-antigen ligase family protein, partial [Anaerolineae bacterium]|nr:O-antigen ligase family protein [Anaerolineae bacterium]